MPAFPKKEGLDDHRVGGEFIGTVSSSPSLHPSAPLVKTAFATPLLRRLAGLALLFTLEVLILSIWLDNGVLAGSHGLAAVIFHWGAIAVRSVTAFAALLLVCALLKNPQLPQTLSTDLSTQPISVPLLALHLCLMSTFAVLSHFLYQPHSSNVLAIAWLAVGTAAAFAAAAAFIPCSTWSRLFAATGFLSLAVASVIGLIAATVNQLRHLWSAATALTFILVRILLHPFFSALFTDPANNVIGTPRFSVEISPQCSGLEGVALILGFTCLWLIFFRKELRFPNALVTVPAGVVLIFLMNSVRIAALIAIGNAGAPHIALGGFHSQAGWIIFIAIALAFVVAAQRIPWLTRTSARPTARASNPTAAFLLPLLATLAVGMATSAATGSFDWLYSLRFFAAAALVWRFRKHYAGLGWRPTAAGPLLGALAFLLWILLDHIHHHPADAIPAALAAATPLVRHLWIAGRITGAVLTVPLAEELAFRGYLLRRIIAPNFNAVPMRRFTWPALLASSLCFGCLHGDQWLAATLAGLLFAAASLRRGRFADAVAAHATANALLAAYVLTFAQWRLW